MSDKTEPQAEPKTWPHTITLKQPFEFADERIAKLVFRHGRLGDLKGVSISTIPTIEQLMLIASRMCGQPIQVIEMLGEEDSPEVVAMAVDFFANALPAGIGL